MRLIQLYRNYILLFIILLFSIFLRMGDINFWDGKYLWAEDGNTFLNSAYSLGVNSIFEPYAGYLHLYPRIVSLISIQFPLNLIPSIFFISWTIAVVFTGFIVFDFIYKYTKDLYLSFLVPVFILIQPHGGEIFFTLTNAQWFFAVALFIILIDDSHNINKNNFLFILFLGLTGPFSILLLPILFLNIFIKRDLKENYFKYFIIMLTSIIQIYFLLQSNRVSEPIDINIIHWLKSFFIFLTFDTRGFFAVLSILIWSILLGYLLKSFCDIYKKEYNINQMNGILIFIGLVILYFAGLWSIKQSPLALSPLGGGARYFFIPYSLFLIALPLLIKHYKVIWIVLLFMLVIDIKQFSTIDRKLLNFQSFAWLSKYSQFLSIPIQPQWSIYPGWHIDINNNEINKAEINLIDLEKLNILNGINYNNNIKAINNDLQLSFNIPDECNLSSHVGVEISLNREMEGYSQIFYSNNSFSFTEQNSLKRYYNKGNVTMQFAFKNNNIQKVRIDPTEKNEIISINYIKVLCDK